VSVGCVRGSQVAVRFLQRK